MIDDKDFVAFFNQLIEASCGRRGCFTADQPTDVLAEEVEDTEDVGLPWGY
jgi:hypothetical protein